MRSDPFKPIRGVVFLLLMTWAAFCVTLLVFPTVLLITLPSKRVIRARRAFVSHWCGKYLEYAAFLIENICGTKIFIHCDNPAILTENNGVLVICNHRTRIDWMFVGWCYGAAIKVAGDMIIILKDALRSAPIFGWLMQLGLYVFLERKRENDIPHITNMLTYLININVFPSLLLFPEGTDLSQSNVEKSDQYAKERGLACYKYVLHPKPSGLVTALNCLRQVPGSMLHDVTIAYDDYRKGIRPNEKTLMLGEFPQAIYLHVERHSVSSMPTEKKLIEQWLRDSFAKKERILSDFYNVPTTITSSQSDDLEAYRKAQESLVRDTWPREVACLPSKGQDNYYAVCQISLIVLVISLSLWHFWIARWASAVVIIVFVSSKSFNGFDNLELTLHMNHSDATAAMEAKKAN